MVSTHASRDRIQNLTMTLTETTGHTLAGTLGFLGIYQEEQDIVYEQIVSVLGNDREPVCSSRSHIVYLTMSWGIIKGF